jgi:hypothetical protein
MRKPGSVRAKRSKKNLWPFKKKKKPEILLESSKGHNVRSY